MPTYPPHACPRCGRTHCAGHRTRPAWEHSHPPRIAGSTLQRLRQRLFQRQPLCVLCEAKGVVTAAVFRDHIVPLAEGGTEAEENTQALCKACHVVKTAEEAKRGMRRKANESTLPLWRR